MNRIMKVKLGFVTACCALALAGSAGAPTDASYVCVATDAKFVDAANGDYRLRPDSSCRNKGLYPSWMTGALDVYGQPRISGRRVDIGAAECPSGLTIMIR